MDCFWRKPCECLKGGKKFLRKCNLAKHEGVHTLIVEILLHTFVDPCPNLFSILQRNKIALESFFVSCVP